MHYFRRPLDLQLTQHNDLDEFLESLDSLRQAAKDDLERAERRQSKTQPSNFVTYAPGYLVLCDPITYTGAVKIQNRMAAI